jgi:hypothetical protein
MHSALESSAALATEEGGGDLAPQWQELAAAAATDKWDDDCRLSGNPFHCAGYLVAHCRRGERPVGILDRRSGRPLIGGIVTGDGSFRSYSFMPQPATGEFGRKIVEWFRAEGCRRFRLGSFFRGLEGQRIPEGVAAVERIEFVHDLGQTQEQWWSELHSQTRRKLRRAEKQGFSLRKIDDNQAAVLARLSLSWSRRRGVSRTWVDLISSWWRYRALLGPMSRGGIGALYGLYEKDGALLSAAYMLETRTSAFYMIGASSEAGYRAGASFDLFWKLGRRYREGGLSMLNFGGVPIEATQSTHPENGVYRFKSGFGSECKRRVTWISKEMRYGDPG